MRPLGDVCSVRIARYFVQMRYLFAALYDSRLDLVEECLRYRNVSISTHTGTSHLRSCVTFRQL